MHSDCGGRCTAGLGARRYRSILLESECPLDRGRLDATSVLACCSTTTRHHPLLLPARVSKIVSRSWGGWLAGHFCPANHTASRGRAVRTPRPPCSAKPGIRFFVSSGLAVVPVWTCLCRRCLLFYLSELGASRSRQAMGTNTSDPGTRLAWDTARLVSGDRRDGSSQFLASRRAAWRKTASASRPRNLSRLVRWRRRIDSGRLSSDFSWCGAKETY